MLTLKKLLLEILKSSTIKPSFKEVHVLLALLIFKHLKEENKGIGRYKLMKKLALSEGKVRSLLERMKKLNLIKAESNLSAHRITDLGEKVLNELFEKISQPREFKFDLKSLIAGECGYYCIVRNGRKNLGSGIEQRDEVIKIGGTGATCLVFDSDLNFKFPNENDSVEIQIDDLNKNLKDVYQEDKEKPVKINDVIVIGAGNKENIARVATLSAALSLTDILKN